MNRVNGMGKGDVRNLAWRLRIERGSRARLLFPLEDAESVRVAISKTPTPVPWHIQLNQANLPVEAGQSYVLVFRARAESRRNVYLGVSEAHPPWGGLGLYREFELRTEWQDHSVEFVAVRDDRNARIHFDLGGNRSSVEFSSVTLRRLLDGRLVLPELTIHGYYPAARWAATGKPAAAGEKLPASQRSLRFSIVIPTYQRREAVVTAVKSFVSQEFDSEFEVIVVVDGSSDGSADALRALEVPFPLTILEQANQGAATARNQGASLARGEILLFLDDDMEAHPRLLAEHDQSYSEGADAVLGHLPLHAKAPAGFLSREYQTWAEARGTRLSQLEATLTLQDLLTGQMSVKPQVFKAIGGFDASFTHGGTYGNEDLDFGYRLLTAGRKVIFNLYALSYHNYTILPRQHLRQARQTGRADVAFARKHPAQKAAVFAPYTTGKGRRPKIWSALAALRPLSTPLTATLRALVLALVEHGIEGPRAAGLFYEIFEMEYWRGVHEAGGTP